MVLKNEVIKKRYLASGFVEVIDVKFQSIKNNDEQGGAFYSSGVDKCSLRRVVFTSCTAKSGGAIAAKQCVLIAYSICFDSCSAGSTSENGGNSIYVENSNLILDLSSSFKCAPDLSHFGDSVVMMSGSETHSTHVNFSSCNGESGECSFGSALGSASRVAYIHVVGCNEDSLIMLDGSTVHRSNFIRNTLNHKFINSKNSKIDSCCFFGNTKDLTVVATFENCFGDFEANGVTKIYKEKTYLQTVVMKDNCNFGYCKLSQSKNLHVNAFFAVLGFLNTVWRYPSVAPQGHPYQK